MHGVLSGFRTPWIFIRVPIRIRAHKKFASPSSSSLFSLFRVRVWQKRSRLSSSSSQPWLRPKPKSSNPRPRPRKNDFKTGFKTKTDHKTYVTAKYCLLFYLQNYLINELEPDICFFEFEFRNFYFSSFGSAKKTEFFKFEFESEFAALPIFLFKKFCLVDFVK